MRITAQQIMFTITDVETWMQKLIPDHAKNRLPGIHLSGLIKEYVLDQGIIYDPQDFEVEFPLRMAMGMAWEAWLVGVRDYKNMDWQPKPWFIDEVSGTPDGVSDVLVNEFKLTYKSSRHKKTESDFIEREQPWLLQLGTNCHMYGKTKGELIVLWVCDDYTWPMKPSLWCYTAEWSKEELEAMWEKLKKYKARAKPELGTGDYAPPPLPPKIVKFPRP